MNEPKTEMPPQIQKCHDVWDNTLDGQLRILGVEVRRAVEVVIVESQAMGQTITDELGRVGKRFFEAAVSVTRFGIEYKDAVSRLTKPPQKP